MPDISIPLALLKKPLEAVGALATGQAKDVIAKIKASGNVKKLHQKLSATQKIKTIWNVDRAISINSFYYPAKIKTQSGNVQTIAKIDEIPANAFIISGTVGQGKSIFLRYLLGKEIKSGVRVPLFVELRRTPVSGLEAYVQAVFDELLEVKGSPEIFGLFASSGRLSILLDGFDEIDPDRVQELTSSIEHLAMLYPQARIVVTSRPNSGLENSPHFDVISLAPLDSTDFFGFFGKILPKDKDLAQRITEAVLASPTQVTSLAGTPLLATLLTIVYRANQKIPSDFAEFYEELFQILLIRHDRSKSGYERKRKTKISDREIQQVFEAFSYKSKAENISSIPRTRALEIAAASISAQSLSCDESHLLTDIVKVTCLLQENGGRIEFLHQSVQEFYAARYIASRPEEVAQRFYQLTCEQKKWQSWEQVLRFLSQIDKYKSSKYFFIPALEETLRALGSLDVAAAPESLLATVAGGVGVRQTIQAGNDGKVVPKYFIHHISEGLLYRNDWIRQRMYALLFGEAAMAKSKWLECFDRATSNQTVSYLEIVGKCGIASQFASSIQTSVGLIQKELNDHRARVIGLKSSGDFMGL
jgi:hypothetical protein